MPSLAGYLTAAAKAPFVWGESDCATFIADWAALWVGGDPAARFRGRYSTEDGAYRLFGRLGLAGAVRACAKDAGLARVREALPGDIAVLRGDRGRPLICGIRTSIGWAIRDDWSILVISEPRPIAIWSVPCRKP